MPFVRPLVVVAVLALMVPGVPAGAQAPAPVIVTEGEGVVRRPPDRAWLTVATETRHRDAATARANAATAMTAVREAILAAGIAADALRTVGFSLTPEVRYDDGRGQVQGYVVRNRLEVRIDDLDRLPAVLDAADARRDTGLSIIGPRFDLRDEADAEAEALRAAVAAARARAAAIAEGAGGRIGAILRIEDHALGGPAPRPEVAMMRAPAMAPAPETPITPGEIEIRASVTLTVVLE